MEAQAVFRFHGTLNDFLIYARRDTWFNYHFRGNPAVKDAIEALGVPHPEVQVILVDQKPVSFTYQLQPEDRVEVFPVNLSATFPEANSLNPPVPEIPKFVLDVHLGKLAKKLRMLGFDTAYRNDYDDKTIADLASTENRIVLTRDAGLLKQKQIIWGYWLRSQMPELQLKEVVSRFKLEKKFAPFTRCLECNGQLEKVDKELVWEQLPPKTRLYFQEFYQCPQCKKVYWKGSHFERMKAITDQFRV